MSFRDEKRSARRALHEEMQVPALYLASVPLTSESADPVPVSIRVHTQIGALGQMRGLDYTVAQQLEPIPQIIFEDIDFLPRKNAVVSVETGEAYRITTVEPPDDISIKCNVVRLSATDAEGLPAPGLRNRYFGAFASDEITAEEIITLGTDQALVRGKTVTYDASEDEDGMYLYYAFPVSFGALVGATVNGLVVTDYTITQVELPNGAENSDDPDGLEDYYLVRINNIQTGAAIPIVWA